MLSVKWVEGIKSKDEVVVNDSKSFFKFMKFEWFMKVIKLVIVIF